MKLLKGIGIDGHGLGSNRSADGRGSCMTAKKPHFAHVLTRGHISKRHFLAIVGF